VVVDHRAQLANRATVHDHIVFEELDAPEAGFCDCRDFFVQQPGQANRRNGIQH
jgi:hypothetical protein